MKLISGIYGIEDVETGKLYVGRADSDNGIKKRWSCHKAHLRNGRHDYNELQDAFNADQNRIKWIILEECPDEELEERENYWIKYVDKIDGWTVINKEKKSKKRSKVKDTSRMSVAQTGENNGHCIKLNKEKVREIKIYQKNNTYNDEKLSEMYNVSLTHIKNIRDGRRWASVSLEDTK
ncbi:GIY-YIG nuclease family protein [Clostridium sp. Marseille-Q7071]